MKRMLFLLLGLLALGCVQIALPAHAQDAVAAFYRGRTMEMLVPTTAGNDFDLRGRLLARFMPDFIPGHPTFITRNMPGGGGIIAMNHMAARVPHDGSTLHMMFPSVGTLQAIGTPEVTFDLRRFNFVGNTSTSPNVMVAWHTAGVTSVDALKGNPLVLGTTSGDSGVYYVRALQQLGYKVSVVSGYAGGAQVNLAMERGEVQGRATNAWAAWKATKPDWVQDRTIIPLVQIGLTRHPDMKDVPLLLELAPNADDRALLDFLSASVALSRSLVTTPGVPADRLNALRRAFDQTVASPAFLAEAGKMGLDMSPLTGEQSQDISHRILDTPPDVIARAKAIMLAP
ncbi:tripartite tricarboxylate transporter substrate-binding protein [Methylocella sp. CPCC 101449]|uniref:Bug family tripartite tricarboxylate transporter substrate binding protein n=1 Tax=Methylocella sp. CPCC 101449 TaxID=2987531 RepID=UPI00288D3DC3|nr:tripartite tricarboxylate transporter substrate-binding protein [Methylocella sp. CPCC 101449]MDT2020598.1 tripartite tricarboxylate transporter substrate-binding protein [Methylocella sp. CPCC 101449]